MSDQEQFGHSTIDQPFSKDAGHPFGMTLKVKPRPKPRKAPGKVDRMPQWKILLHNDDINEIGYVVETLVELAALNPLEALIHTLEAHRAGLALIMMTHQERAELLAEQFMSKQLSVSIEPDC